MASKDIVIEWGIGASNEQFSVIKSEVIFDYFAHSKAIKK
jgi:hypothetical protein